jgi:hypothetical protein
MTLTGEGLLDSKIPALDWKTRLKIALHIMQGLKRFPRGRFVLLDNNIFLTKNCVPKIRVRMDNSLWGSWLS